MTEWRKILYERQPFPDNYVERTLFLAELKKNGTVKLHTYGWLVRHSLFVMQQVSCVLIFVCFFVFLLNAWVSAASLILLSNTVTLVFYFFWIAWVWSRSTDRVASKQAGKSGILFMTVLLGLTPILKTLTEDTSHDTIWALSSLCLLVNVLFFDYMAEGPRSDDSVALNAAIFASVMLASRLSSSAHVFGLMTLSVLWFALFPVLRRAVFLYDHRLDLLMSIILMVLAGSMLAAVGPVFLALYVVSLLVGTIVCPAIFVYLQRFKNEIHGPWDEASVITKLSLSRFLAFSIYRLVGIGIGLTDWLERQHIQYGDLQVTNCE
ncbi:Gpi2p [Paramicrosporidium saccamoebae]|uniref:Gpi2p n=1 Tax=Paramicrosporidium saccamoebae TaxID=1246581 RepID=A0A2H9TP98_9FUNG|nr:Gpi2p [Paramicrosporidium saccamoebae]